MSELMTYENIPKDPSNSNDLPENIIKAGKIC